MLNCWYNTKESGVHASKINIHELYPTYPNKLLSGIGKAHAYAIKYLHSDMLDIDNDYENCCKLKGYKL